MLQMLLCVNQDHVALLVVAIQHPHHRSTVADAHLTSTVFLYRKFILIKNTSQIAPSVVCSASPGVLERRGAHYHRS